MKNKTIVALYTRVSTQEQTEGYSIGEQKSRLEKYAEAHDWIVYKWYNDPGYSGGSRDRPALQMLIKDVEKKKVDKVIVYKLDRLSRSQKDTLFLIEDVFLRNNVDFVSMTENFDTSTPLGRAMIGILSVFSQLEREQIKERMQMGLDARAAEGYFHGGGYSPIGYTYDNGVLIIDEYEAMQIRTLYDLFISGMPIYSIYKYMKAHHYSHKYGDWTDDSIKSCLTSVVFNGKIKWKGEIYPGKHKAIIDDETFEKAAKILDRRKKDAEHREHPFKRTTMLGGIIWCGNCGARYYCKQNVSKNPGTTPAQRYYTCYSRGKSKKTLIRDPNCKNKSWNVKDLDAVIVSELQKLALEPGYLDELTAPDPSASDNIASINTLKKHIDSLNKQIDKLMELYALDKIDFNIITQRIDKLTAEKENIEEELSNLECTHEPELSIEQTRAIIQTIPSVLEGSDPEELKNLVHSLIKAIIIHNDSLEIHWYFQ